MGGTQGGSGEEAEARRRFPSWMIELLVGDGREIHPPILLKQDTPPSASSGRQATAMKRTLKKKEEKKDFFTAVVSPPPLPQLAVGIAPRPRALTPLGAQSLNLKTV